MKNKKRSIEIAFVTVPAVILIAVCIFFVFQNIKNTRKDITDELKQTAEQSMKNLQDYFSSCINIIYNLGADIAEYDDGTELKNNEPLRRILASECKQNNFLALTISREEDFLQTDYISYDNKIVSSPLKAEYIKQDRLAQNGRCASNTVYLNDFKQNVNFLFQKISSKKGEEYIVSAILPDSVIEEKLNEGFFSGSGYNIICRKNGDIVVRTDYNKVFGTELDLSNISDNDIFVLKDKNDDEYYAVNSNLGFSDDWNILTVVPKSAFRTKVISLSSIILRISIIIVVFSMASVLFFLIYTNTTNKRILKAAYTDELTGFPNKQFFKIRANEILLSNRLQKYAVVILDIDNFKIFNDIFGFPEGDNVLRYAAETINSSLEEGEIFCRTSSDNFYILTKYESKKVLRKRLLGIMDKISSYETSDMKNYKIISYCGVYKISAKNVEKGISYHIDRARLALTRIVRNHKNGYTFYNDSVRNDILFETELENDMEKALENGEFVIYIQPKYRISDGTVAGGEALIRWNHSTKGFLTPNKFIDLFERNRFIIKLDYYVLETICRLQRQWLDKGYNVVVVSVNQSRLNLFQKNYVNTILDLIKRSNVPPELVELEITETVAYNNFDEIVKVVDELHKSGIRFSMDDFGSGYSSLNMLGSLDIDVIKLDKGFFDNSIGSKKGRVIVGSALEMARKLNIETVSEGVETQEQVDFLKTANCDIAQGYYYSKPIPIEEFEELIKK